MPIYDPAHCPIPVGPRRPDPLNGRHHGAPPNAATCAGPERIRPLGVFTTVERPIVATATSPGEVRLDLLGVGGWIIGPLAVLTGLDTAVPLVFLDVAQRSWADEPAIAWLLTRNTIDRYRSAPVASLDNPNAPTLETSYRERADVDGGAGHGGTPLGTFTIQGRLVVVTEETTGRLRLDLLSPGGVVSAALGVVTGADTAIPLLFIDTAQLSWAAEPAIAWYLTRSGIDRYRGHRVTAARTGGATPNRADTTTESDHADPREPDAHDVVVELCGPDTLDTDYTYWWKSEPHRLSHALAKPRDATDHSKDDPARKETGASQRSQALADPNGTTNHSEGELVRVRAGRSGPLPTDRDGAADHPEEREGA